MNILSMSVHESPVMRGFVITGSTDKLFMVSKNSRDAALTSTFSKSKLKSPHKIMSILLQLI